MKKTFIICVLTINLYVFISAQTLYKNSEKGVEKRCLQDPYVKTTLLTECVLECQRKQLHPIHKEDECFCVENECLVEETEETNSTMTEIISRLDDIRKYQMEIKKIFICHEVYYAYLYNTIQ